MSVFFCKCATFILMKLGLVNILLEYILFILSIIFTPTTEALFSQLVSLFIN